MRSSRSGSSTCFPLSFGVQLCVGLFLSGMAYGLFCLWFFLDIALGVLCLEALTHLAAVASWHGAAGRQSRTAIGVCNSGVVYNLHPLLWGLT